MRVESAILSQVDAVRCLREEVRAEEGGGGYCHVVSEVLACEYGWSLFSGAYTSLAGEVICEAHVWNLLPDGSILDATADQFGEGHDVRVLTPDNPDFLRYRAEWYPDWNPELCPCECPRQLGYSKWTGELDVAQAKRLTSERGEGWWLKDQTAYLAYQARQCDYASRRKRQGNPQRITSFEM